MWDHLVRACPAIGRVYGQTRDCADGQMATAPIVTVCGPTFSISGSAVGPVAEDLTKPTAMRGLSATGIGFVGTFKDGPCRGLS